jgi:hypothetical protein
MTEQEFLLLAKAKYTEISELKKQPTLLDYEQGFVDIWQELGRQVLQADLGDPGKDRRKKRNTKPPSEPSK